MWKDNCIKITLFWLKFWSYFAYSRGRFFLYERYLKKKWFSSSERINLYVPIGLFDFQTQSFFINTANFIRLPQIRAANLIVLGSRIFSFGQQLRYFFGQLNYLLWKANLFYWAARLIIWAAKFIEKSTKLLNGQQLFSLLNFR